MVVVVVVVFVVIIVSLEIAPSSVWIWIHSLVVPSADLLLSAVSHMYCRRRRRRRRCCRCGRRRRRCCFCCYCCSTGDCSIFCLDVDPFTGCTVCRSSPFCSKSYVLSSSSSLSLLSSSLLLLLLFHWRLFYLLFGCGSIHWFYRLPIFSFLQ